MRLKTTVVRCFSRARESISRATFPLWEWLGNAYTVLTHTAERIKGLSQLCCGFAGCLSSWITQAKILNKDILLADSNFWQSHNRKPFIIASAHRCIQCVGWNPSSSLSWVTVLSTSYSETLRIGPLLLFIVSLNLFSGLETCYNLFFLLEMTKSDRKDIRYSRLLLKSCILEYSAPVTTHICFVSARKYFSP